MPLRSVTCASAGGSSYLLASFCFSPVFGVMMLNRILLRGSARVGLVPDTILPASLQLIPTPSPLRGRRSNPSLSMRRPPGSHQPQVPYLDWQCYRDPSDLTATTVDEF